MRHPIDLALDLAGTFKEQRLDAYERLLTDVVKGNLTLFMRRDELDAAWRWIDPIREGWAQHDERIKSYVAGSWGPAESDELLGRDGRAWRTIGDDHPSPEPSEVPAALGRATAGAH